jgi:Mor family transcriptional regulator
MMENNKLDWKKELKIEDLPEVYRMIAEAIGVENTVKLSELLGGTPYYFPKIDKLLMMKRDELIREQFNGSNHKSLALKFGVSEVTIRNKVNGKDTPKDAPQDSLF